MNQLTQEQLAKLLATQVQFQTELGVLDSPDVLAKLPFALLDELAELNNWTNWKWWKAPNSALETERAKRQQLLELADILHFVLIAGTYTNYAEDTNLLHNQTVLADRINAALNYRGFGSIADMQASLLDCTARASHRVISIDQHENNFVMMLVIVMRLTLDYGFTWEDLLGAYYGKVALNKLRAANGYKEGSYRKIWCVDDQGEPLEDNDVMLTILPTTAPELLYQELANIYAASTDN